MIEEFGFILGRLKAAGWCWGKNTGKDTLNGFYGSVEGKYKRWSRCGRYKAEVVWALVVIDPRGGGAQYITQERVI